jgi:hypothetical protein
MYNGGHGLGVGHDFDDGFGAGFGAGFVGCCLGGGEVLGGISFFFLARIMYISVFNDINLNLFFDLQKILP